MGSKKNMIRKRIARGSKQSAKELASCYGKIRHASYEAAAKKNEIKIDFVRPYKCKFCPYYHVGRRTASK